MSNAQLLTAPTRRSRKKERTRREIYNAAMSLFREKSFDDVTITEICEAADVGRGTFFLHFPTKASLLYEFNTRVAESFRSERVQSPSSAQDELKSLVDYMSTKLHSDRRVMRAMLSDFFSSPEAVSSQAIDDDALAELVTGIIKAGQDRGEFSQRIDAQLAAATFFAAAAAILSGRVFAQGDVTADEINRQFLQIIFSGLSPDGETGI